MSKLDQLGLPNTWKIKKTGDLCNSVVPGRNKPKKWGGNIPWIRTEDLAESIYLNTDKIEFWLDEEEIKKAGGKIVPEKTVIMTCVGNLGQAVITKQKVTMNQQLHGFLCKNEIVPEFLAYSIQNNKNIIINLAQKTSVLYLNKDNCESIPIFVPPLAEQQKISSILLNIDSIIQSTQLLIRQLQTLKKGLMQTLFSNGLRHSEFKESKLGKIPKEWEIVQIQNVTSACSYGLNASAFDYNQNLPRFVRITDITDDGNLLQTDKKSVPLEGNENYLLKENDLVFARTGATVGKTYLYNKDDGICIYAGYLIKFQPDINKIDPKFLFFITKSSFYKRWVLNMMRTGAQPNINSKEYNSFSFPYPPISEQKEIVKTLEICFNKIETENFYIKNLELLKQGLMQQLLTGKMRVKI